MSECSELVFKGRIERKLRSKNKVLKQKLFCFKFSLCPLPCFLTVHRRGQGGERAPPLIRFPSLQKSFKGGKRHPINKEFLSEI